MINLAFHQVLFLSTITRHYGILIVFLCLHHRLIQFLIDLPFFISVVPLRNSLPSTIPFTSYLLPLSPMLLLICINSVSLYLFLFLGKPLK